MTGQLREFVATELWLLVAIVTLPLSGLAALAGLGSLAAGTAVVGWFLLTPVLMFWGDEFAALLFDRSETADSDEESDALAALKRRYAEGEIGDAEFERRLERLLDADAADDDVHLADSTTQDGESSELEGER